MQMSVAVILELASYLFSLLRLRFLISKWELKIQIIQMALKILPLVFNFGHIERARSICSIFHHGFKIVFPCILPFKDYYVLFYYYSKGGKLWFLFCFLH